MTTQTIKLLPETRLVRTGPVDHAAWNYRGVLGWVQRTRFRLIRQLMGTSKYQSLLEVGYGSGVFMPELAESCDRLHGVDVHDRATEVANALRLEGVAATLKKGSAEAIPLENGSMDAIVAVSVLEFVDDMEATCREFLRVLKPGGALFVVTPGVSPLLDFGLRVLTGKSARTDFANRRELVLPALARSFRTQARVTFPPAAIPGVRLYTALKLTPREA